VPLPFQFQQGNAIRQGPAGKLIVLGMAAGYVYELGILDTNASRIIDHFNCYAPAISPDGQYIAFTKLFSPHSSPSPADHSMLYVVALSPPENRPHGISLSDETDVGFEVFPPGKGNWKADNMNVALGSDYSVAGGYIWKGTDQYFFADGSGAELSLVWVSIGDGSASVRTATLVRQKSVGGYAPRAMLRKVDLTDSAVSVAFSQPAFNRTLRHDDFGISGSVNFKSLPIGKP
jgi:hypothetical protein